MSRATWPAETGILLLVDVMNGKMSKQLEISDLAER